MNNCKGVSLHNAFANSITELSLILVFLKILNVTIKYDIFKLSDFKYVNPLNVLAKFITEVLVIIVWLKI